MSLQQDLENFKAKFSQTAPDDKKAAYETGISQIRESGLIEGALNKGQLAKDFTLLNALGHSVNLFQVLGQGPVILT
ncbi:MAG: hypothetical protein O3C43_16975 [Verrucomicrobia bacterium]|nr:hypothetical protein [Verrucomicrobiota bacterium]MDA1068183.1 hypothetical protein [Verrucomicrobiota bacterium]